jgi:hypothetical protein
MERRMSIMSKLDLFKKIEKTPDSPRASDPVSYPTIHTKTAQELLELLSELDESGNNSTTTFQIEPPSDQITSGRQNKQ